MVTGLGFTPRRSYEIKRQRRQNDLGVRRVFKLSTDERVERVPVGIGDVAADGPQVAEHERGADDGVELGRISVDVHALRDKQQALQQLAQRHHLTDVHLVTNKSFAVFYLY